MQAVGNFFNEKELIKKYNYSGPRYTSYPTALEFNTAYQSNSIFAALQQDPTKPLSLYIHIPFCHKICYFCACNKIITRQNSKVDKYLTYLMQEIKTYLPYTQERVVSQLHFGGGTPTFMNMEQFATIINFLKDNFTFTADAEISVELDPNEIDLAEITALHDLGFNRLSMGIQDLSKEVQQAINREEDFAHVKKMILHAKSLNFSSVNLDLIYGLPYQTAESFATTLHQVIQLDPDRLSIFNYAHLPSKFAAQRKIKTETLPNPKTKLKILENTIKYLEDNEYVFIGMDHFAKASDELTKAMQRGDMHRNFQGYTTQANTELLAFGVSSISNIGNQYAQNTKNLTDYYTRLDNNVATINKGYILTQDDVIRGDIIQSLICNFELKFSVIEAKYQISYQEYFAAEFKRLENLAQDNLIQLTDTGIKVTEYGRLLIRHICLVFDKYSTRNNKLREFSRII